MSETWFCPVCWHHSTERLERCPKCEHSIILFEYEIYAEKLMRALSHPVREQRMIAIETLGKLHYIPAIPEFEHIVRSEEDAYVISEVIDALRETDTPECRRILSSLHAHSSVIVRNKLQAMDSLTNNLRTNGKVGEGESGS